MAEKRLPAVRIDPPVDAPRLIGEVRQYWLGKRAGLRLPSRTELRPSELKAWLPHVLLADAINDGADFRYRLVGTRIAQDFSLPPTGRLMSDVLANYGEQAVRETIRMYRRVVEDAAPLHIRGSGEWYAQDAKTFDAILMPLADDGVRVNMIFGAFVFDWDKDRSSGTSQSPLAAALQG
jgi:hypothetical protein